MSLIKICFPWRFYKAYRWRNPFVLCVNQTKPRDSLVKFSTIFHFLVLLKMLLNCWICLLYTQYCNILFWGMIFVPDKIASLLSLLNLCHLCVFVYRDICVPNSGYWANVCTDSANDWHSILLATNWQSLQPPSTTKRFYRKQSMEHSSLL